MIKSLFPWRQPRETIEDVRKERDSLNWHTIQLEADKERLGNSVRDLTAANEELQADVGIARAQRDALIAQLESNQARDPKSGRYVGKSA